eukprot:TRINITY_DN55667_c0_g1_i1.p2 TRINITY_DN55667_c0_g1~~TRINITY_DN55667_c0_g1_i1.p2  ORF type:complete len:210 (-),score=52.12 TRINITY_DN55667_c0_g1_i1:48-677(-)
MFRSFSSADQARLLFVAVGKHELKAYNANFCKGAFPATDMNEWWEEFGAQQRMIAVLTRSADGAWQRHCTLNMDANSQEEIRGALEASLRSAASRASSSSSSSQPGAAAGAALRGGFGGPPQGGPLPPQFGQFGPGWQASAQEAAAAGASAKAASQLLLEPRPAAPATEQELQMDAAALHVAGLGYHTVTDDLMFPVLVLGFAIVMFWR